MLRTVAETAVFSRYAADIWNDSERMEFISWIASHPDAGTVIPGSGGCRKVRWTKRGRGKRGGVRVIYFCAHDDVIWLLIVYAKSAFEKLPAAFLSELKKGIEDVL